MASDKTIFIKSDFPGYLGVPIQHLSIVNLLCGNAYINNKSELQLLVKDQFNIEELTPLHLHFFIREEDQYEFSNLLESLEPPIPAKKESSLKSVFSEIATKIAKIEIALKQITYFIKAVKDNNKLHSYAVNLLKNKSVEYQTVLLTSTISYEIITEMHWGTQNQAKNNFEKVCFAAIFHDIALEGTKFKQIHNEKMLAEIENDTSRGDKELILNHASRSASLVQQCTNIPLDVEQIIKQHHGVTNGIGFTDSFGQKVLLLSIVFIISHAAAVELAKPPGERPSIVDIINSFYQRFGHQSYKKVIDALNATIIKNLA